MKKFLQEFKSFAMRGNVLDLAVGVIIGGAFQGLVKSLTETLINPLLGLFVSQNFDTLTCTLLGATFRYGEFVTAVINFVIMAFVVFLLVKGLGRIAALGRKQDTPAAPQTKTCPYCCSEIPVAATRCAHCTSLLNDET